MKLKLNYLEEILNEKFVDALTTAGIVDLDSIRVDDLINK
jgi:hypothetical protein